jgi:lipopolysaccharide/colanic/teichoic acid biosynthesis glycosyltransferase
MWWTALNNVIKRLFDILSSLIALVLLSPVLLACAIWVKRDSEGPAIFRQDRLTKDGRIFKMLKFRSMVQNAEKTGAGLFNYEGDPRVTRCGRFLREHSLDELPQLLNILKGDMSVVGPRPCVVYELGDYATLNRRFKKRFQVKAGLTGYAQIQGRNDLEWDQKVDFDNRYIDSYRKWGVAFDLYIIIRTIAGVFRHEDIYEKRVADDISDDMSAELAQAKVIEMAHREEEVKVKN